MIGIAYGESEQSPLPTIPILEKNESQRLSGAAFADSAR